jgi:hypothetical protein
MASAEHAAGTVSEGCSGRQAAEGAKTDDVVGPATGLDDTP